MYNTSWLCVLSHLQPPWTVARQVPVSMEFSRQEYWSELPFPTPGDLPNLGIKPTSLSSPVLAGWFFTNCSTLEAPSCLLYSPIQSLLYLFIYFSSMALLFFPVVLSLNLFIFNWRMIALQYFVGFYQTSTWISHKFTHVPSHFNIPSTFLPVLPL